MADITIFGLDARTSLADTDVLEVDNASAADDSEKAALSLLRTYVGGLKAETSRDTNANHADFSGTVGQLHCVDMSGAALTSEVVFTLPATAAVGEKVGLYITAGSSTDGEELSVRTPASDTINGTDYSAADWSRLYVTGERVVFECIVANTDWVVVSDGRRRCSGFRYLGTTTTGSTIGTAAWVSLQGTSGAELTSLNDVGDWFTSSNRVKARRDCGIILSAQAVIDDMDLDEVASIRFHNQTSGVRLSKAILPASHANDYQVGLQITTGGELSDGDEVSCDVFHNAADGAQEFVGSSGFRETWVWWQEVLK